MATRASSTALARRLGRRIRALRIEKGATQEQLAWASEVDKGYMSLVEAGKRVPSVAVLDVIARRLGVELADLFAGGTGARGRLAEACRRGDRAEARAALEDLERTWPERPPKETRLRAAEPTARPRRTR